jgi:hypothetical protein
MKFSYTHGGELCIISSYRICEEHTGTALLGASSTEMMQDFPLHLLDKFERIQQRHYGMKVMAYTLIFQ